MLKFDHEELLPVFNSMVSRLKTGYGSLAEDIYKIDVNKYCDESQWTMEIDRIFRKKPLALAFTAELREHGSYYATTVFETPVLLTRTAAGELKAFLNACRHRGMQLVPDGTGRMKSLTCLYHGWTYSLDGRLIGVSDAKLFGNLDKSCYGLTPLPVEERSGIVWVVLTPGVPLNLDEWLGDLGSQIEKMGLEQFEVFTHWRLDSANWKLAMDGYLENYHFASLHGKGLATYQIPNFVLFDAFGLHCRQVSPIRAIESFVPPVDRKWCTSELLQYAFNVFPNMQIAFGHVKARPDPIYWALVSQIFPDVNPGKSFTVQRIITSREVRGTDFEAEVCSFASLIQKTVRDEDNPAVLAVQATLKSRACEHFVIGRNEIALQHLHRSVERALALE